MTKLDEANPILHIVAEKNTKARGIYSCCSANPHVLKAALLRAKRYDTPVLIEATANQVDQYGGYTGMNPADFYEFVHSLARETGIRAELVVLGGDHLGPLTFARSPAEPAMNEAAELVRQYAAAGFTKIHLDTSMRLGGDSPDQPLQTQTIAQRGAMLCRVAEEAYAKRRGDFPDAPPPVYVIGSEVPIPGGAQQEEEGVPVTSPDECERTINAYREAFAAEKLEDAWERVVGVVVQLGVEFTGTEVFAYDREKACVLTSAFKQVPRFVLEAHSTDYQSRHALREMVEDGAAILKVGPALTFALREALLALELIEREMYAGTGCHLSDFRGVLEAAMLDSPQNWEKHYHSGGTAQRFARVFSLSDRARYYLDDPTVRACVVRLLANLGQKVIPLALVSQYMPQQYRDIKEGLLRNDPEEMLLDHIGRCIDDYLYATGVLVP